MSSDPSTEPDEATLQAELMRAGVELAEYASYAEIVGAIRHNQEPIRNSCDEVFRLNNALRRIREDREDAAAAAAS